MRQASQRVPDSAEKTVRDIRRATRRHHSAEEKIRIVLEGLRGEDSIAELCRKEGINQNLYYRWSKEFLEAGKKRLAGDTAREATSDEVKELKAEARQLKETLAIADDGKMAGMLGRVRSQGHKGCQRIIRVKRGTAVLGVPFGAGSAHVMEFGPIGIEQASGQILQRFAQIGHHRVGSASSSLSHGPLPAPSFPRPLSGQVVKKR
jgi:transposase